MGFMVESFGVQMVLKRERSCLPISIRLNMALLQVLLIPIGALLMDNAILTLSAIPMGGNVGLQTVRLTAPDFCKILPWDLNLVVRVVFSLNIKTTSIFQQQMVDCGNLMVRMKVQPY